LTRYKKTYPKLTRRREAWGVDNGEKGSLSTTKSLCHDRGLESSLRGSGIGNWSKRVLLNCLIGERQGRAIGR